MFLDSFSKTGWDKQREGGREGGHGKKTKDIGGHLGGLLETSLAAEELRVAIEKINPCEPRITPEN